MNQLEELKSKFTQRGYPGEDITSQFNKASNIDRKENPYTRRNPIKNVLYFQQLLIKTYRTSGNVLTKIGTYSQSIQLYQKSSKRNQS